MDRQLGLLPDLSLFGARQKVVQNDQIHRGQELKLDKEPFLPDVRE